MTLREAGPDRKAGFIKNKKNSDAMVRYASMLMRSWKLRISENLRSGRDTRPQDMADKLIDQMRGYRCEIKLNKNDIMSDPKFKWYRAKKSNDGCLTANRLGDKDDLLVAAMEGLYCEKMFWLSDYVGYDKFKREL